MRRGDGKGLGNLASWQNTSVTNTSTQTQTQKQTYDYSHPPSKECDAIHPGPRRTAHTRPRRHELMAVSRRQSSPALRPKLPELPLGKSSQSGERGRPRLGVGGPGFSGAPPCRSGWLGQPCHFLLTWWRGNASISTARLRLSLSSQLSSSSLPPVYYCCVPSLKTPRAFFFFCLRDVLQKHHQFLDGFFPPSI